MLEWAPVLLAAPGAGGAQYALKNTVQYAKDGQQFDQPVGAFRALAHYLADAVTNLDGTEKLVHEAAQAGATGRSLESPAPMTKICACSTFRDITDRPAASVGSGSPSTSTSSCTSGGPSSNS